MSDKGAKYGLVAGFCFATSVLVADFATDKFNMVDHFKASTESAYQLLYLSSLIGGGITGGGLGAAARQIRDRPSRGLNLSMSGL